MIHLSHLVLLIITLTSLTMQQRVTSSSLNKPLNSWCKIRLKVTKTYAKEIMMQELLSILHALKAISLLFNISLNMVSSKKFWSKIDGATLHWMMPNGINTYSSKTISNWRWRSVPFPTTSPLWTKQEIFEIKYRNEKTLAKHEHYVK